MRAIFDPDAPFDPPRPELGPDGLTDTQRRSHRLAGRLLLPLLAVFVVWTTVFYVFFDFAKVDGESMAPTLASGERVLITKGLADPKRGDVVVIRVDEPTGPHDWIKRVIALGGDLVSFRGDAVLVNGQPETFPHATLTNEETLPVGEYTVPADSFFAVGDNRGVSFDSRFVGPFKRSALHGRVVAVYTPLNRVRLIPAP